MTSRMPLGGQDYDFQFKVIVVGDSSVGKSCFLLRLTDDYFRKVHIHTIGVDFKVKTIEIGTHRIKANIWDTAGEERFRSLTNCFYRGANCAIIAFSLADKHSFGSVPRWISEVTMKASGATMLLVGTKADLEDERQVSHTEAKVLAERLGLMYAETSAKTGQRVEEAFEEIMAARLEKEIGGSMLAPEDSDTIRLTLENYSSSEWCSSLC